MKKSIRSSTTMPCVVILGAVAACSKAEPPPGTTESSRPSSTASAAASAKSGELSRGKLAMFAALPTSFDRPPTSDAEISLGRMLYYDARLSLGQSVSCNTCHDLDKGGVDGTPVSTGHRGQKGTRNSPTVFNAAGEFVQFWDGRAADVEAQALGPLTNPVEMAMPSNDAVVAALASIPGYAPAFEAAFPGQKPAITIEHTAAAIGAFERRLVTPARFDKYLAGDKTALTEDEKAGFDAFFDTGCSTCHSGALVGGAMYQKLGLVKPWPDTKDEGRFAVTKDENDKMMFKVPSLRNVTKTAPYFHDGSVATLPEAVRLMGQHELGRELDDATIAKIVTWLGSLEAAPPADLVRKPDLPKSGPHTPKPRS